MRSGWEVKNGGCLVLVGCFFYDLGAPGRARSLARFKEMKGKGVSSYSQSSRAVYMAPILVFSLIMSCERCGTAPRELTAT